MRQKGLIVLATLSFMYSSASMAAEPLYTKLTYSVAFTQNPSDALSTAQHSVNQLVYETLLRFDDRMDIKPGLAQSWTFEEGGRTLRFNLAQGHKFSDGSLVTPADVRASLEYLFYKSANRSHFTSVQSMRVEGPDLVVRLKQTSPLVIPLLASATAVISKQGHPEIGSGPYKVSSQAKDCLHLERTDSSYKLATIRLCQENEDAAIEALANGRAQDMIDVFINKAVPVDALKKANLQRTTANYTWLLALNQTNKALKDAKTRHCLDQSFPRQTFIHSFVPIHSPAHQLYPMESGNVSDQQMSKCFKRSARVSVLVPKEIDRAAEVCAFLKNHFETNGAKVECTNVDFSDLLKRLQKGRFDIALIAIGLEIPSPLYFFTFFNTHGAFSLSGRTHRGIQDELHAAVRDNSSAERLVRLNKLNHIVAKESLVIPISHTAHSTLINKCVRGLDVSPLGPAYTSYKNVEWEAQCSKP